jgi:transcriptional regulator with XRE-family HTH domain
MRPDDVLSRREKLRLSVAELARLAGVDKHTIHRIEDGRHSPVSSTLDKIAAALVAEELRVLAHLQALHGNLPPPAPLEAKSPAPATAPVLRQNGAGAFHSEGRAA